MMAEAEMTKRLARASTAAIDTLGVLGQMPLATINDLTGVSRFGRSRVDEAVKELRAMDLALPAHLGWNRDKEARWYIPDEALDPVDAYLGPSLPPCSGGTRNGAGPGCCNG